MYQFNLQGCEARNRGSRAGRSLKNLENLIESPETKQHRSPSPILTEAKSVDDFLPGVRERVKQNSSWPQFAPKLLIPNILPFSWNPLCALFSIPYLPSSSTQVMKPMFQSFRRFRNPTTSSSSTVSFTQAFMMGSEVLEQTQGSDFPSNTMTWKISRNYSML